MKKRILSLLLALLMVVSILPIPSYAEDSTDVTITPTEETSEPTTEPAPNPEKCEKCGEEDCTGHANWCAVCLTDNCDVDHGAAISEDPTEATTEPEEEADGTVCDKGCNVDTVGAHNDDCAVKVYYKNLFNDSTAQELYKVWSSLPADAQEYILNNVAWGDQTKRAELVALIEGGVEIGCGCCEGCTGDETCACECEACTCKPEEPTEEPTQEPTEPEETEPENTCGCCEDCTGGEGCECQCGECDFCEEEEELVEGPIYGSVNGQTITINGKLPEGAQVDISALNKESGVVNVTDFDISLTVNGEPYEPEKGVRVSISGLDVAPGSFVKVTHYIEDVDAIKRGYAAGTIQVWTDSSIAASYPAAAAAASEALGMADTVCVEQFYSTENEVDVSNGAISFAATSFSIYTVSYTGTDAGRAYAVYDDDNGTAQNSNGYSSTHEVTMDDSNNATFMLTRGQKFYLDIGSTFFKTGMTSYQWYLSEDSIGTLDRSGFGTLAGNDTVLTVATNAPHYKHYTITLEGLGPKSAINWSLEVKDRRYINVYIVPEVQLVFNANIPTGATSNNVTVPTNRKTVLGDGSTSVKYTRIQVSNPSGSVTGYTFDGWYTAPIGGINISSGSYIFLDNDNAELIPGGNGDQYRENLYAQWKTTVTYDEKGGSAVTDVTYNVNSDPDPVIPTTSRSGYTFFGWYSSYDGVIYQPNQSYTGDAPTTMTALWGKQDSNTNWRKNFYVLPGTSGFCNELKDIDGGTGPDFGTVGDSNTYYVAPGTTMEFACAGGLWRIDGAHSGITVKAGSATVGSNGWSAASGTATVTVSGSAAEGTTLMVYTRTATGTTVNCARFIVKTKEDVTTMALNDSQGIYRVGVYIINDSTNIPGEPNYTSNVAMINVNGQNFAQSGAGIVNPGIATSANYIPSLDGTCTMGVVDYTGRSTIPFLSETVLTRAMDRVIDELKKADGAVMTAADGKDLRTLYNQNGEAYIRENYAVRPHIVKLMTGLAYTNLGWHIDCTIYPLKTVTLTYNLNPPVGYVLKNQATPAPNVYTGDLEANPAKFAVTSDIVAKQKVTASVSGSSDTASLEFAGWNSKPDGTGTAYAPGSEITLTEDAILYAQWTGGNFTTGTLEVYKKVIVATNSIEPSATDTFTFTINLTGSYAYNKYNATTGALVSSGTMTNGTFTLQDGQFVRFVGVPVASYTVTETLPNNYTNDSSSQTLELVGGYVNAITFTNTYCYRPTYTVTWKNWDGITLDTDSVLHGDTPSYIGSNPTRTDATGAVAYTWTGWSPTISAVTGNVTYTATFSSSPSIYKVTLNNQEADAGKEGTAEYWYQFNTTVEHGYTDVNDGGLIYYYADETCQTPFINGTGPDRYYSIAVPQKTGYKFAGYFTAKDGQGTQYINADGICVNDIWKNVTADSNLFAYWIPIYTITWVNEDGSVLETDEKVECGATPTYDGDEPTKEATAEYTYAFAGWTPEVVAVTGDATYTATYTATKNSYTITWLNDDNSVIDTTTVAYGEVPTHADPGKTATAEFTYTFAGWTPEVVAVTGEATYQATYTATKNKYTVTWINEDGTVLETDTGVEYGATPTYDGEEPTKEPNNQYTYTFAGWSPAISTVTGDAVYTATFDPHENYYTVTWVNHDGTVLKKNENVAWGTMPNYNGDTPEKTGNAEHSYTFAGWSPTVSMVNGNATYTATFTESINTYTVTWKHEDGTVLEIDENVVYGATPSYDGETPVKEATTQYTYTFDGWDKAVVSVTGDVTYTTKFKETVNKYTVTFVDEDGTTILKEATEYEYGTAAEDIVKPADPTKEATTEYTYTFVGWTPEISDVTGNATYRATYTPTINQYTLSGVIDHGTVTGPVTVDYGQEAYISFSAADGYMIARWKVGNEPEITHTNPFANWGLKVEKLTENTIVYAYTNPITYSITYNLDGGSLAESVTNPETYNVETETFTLNNPTRDGYEFMGWATTEDAETGDMTVTIEKGTTGDKTYYATWKQSIADLKISITGNISDQNYVFSVTNSQGTEVNRVVLYAGKTSITIRDLPVDTYSVTPISGWAWRQDVIVTLGATLPTITEVTFSRGNDVYNFWLNGYGYGKGD